MNTASPMSGTLASALYRREGIGADLVAIGGAAALTAVAAQIQIPWQPVPWTLQTLVVAAAGLTLGARRGALSQLTYLAVGLAGAPVFAGFKGGPAALFGPTGGYLIAFVLAAWLLGMFADRGWDRRVPTTFVALIVANAAILALGTTWLSVYVGWDQAIALGVLPFLAGDLVKNAIVLFGVPAAWKLLGHNR